LFGVLCVLNFSCAAQLFMSKHEPSNINNYACKYRISFAKNYVTKCGICYNIDTKRVIKQTINSRCIGYVINGKFKSLTYLKVRVN
jgi:hypothetical protein